MNKDLEKEHDNAIRMIIGGLLAVFLVLVIGSLFLDESTFALILFSAIATGLVWLAGLGFSLLCLYVAVGRSRLESVIFGQPYLTVGIYLAWLVASGVLVVFEFGLGSYFGPDFLGYVITVTAILFLFGWTAYRLLRK